MSRAPPTSTSWGPARVVLQPDHRLLNRALLSVVYRPAHHDLGSASSGCWTGAIRRVAPEDRHRAVGSGGQAAAADRGQARSLHTVHDHQRRVVRRRLGAGRRTGATAPDTWCSARLRDGACTPPQRRGVGTHAGLHDAPAPARGHAGGTSVARRERPAASQARLRLWEQHGVVRSRAYVEGRS